MSACPRSLLLVLLIVLSLQSCVMGDNPNMPQKCCMSFFTRQIPVSAILKYEETRANCGNRGVIFTTKKKLEVCVDPRSEWVKRVMDTLDLQLFQSD